MPPCVFFPKYPKDSFQLSAADSVLLGQFLKILRLFWSRNNYPAAKKLKLLSLPIIVSVCSFTVVQECHNFDIHLTEATLYGENIRNDTHISYVSLWIICLPYRTA